MNFPKTTLLFLLAICFFACKKEKDVVIPAMDPCEGLAIAVTPLKAIWATADIYANADNTPIVYGNQIIINKWGSTFFHKLIGLNKQTGAQEWEVKVPGSFFPKYAKIKDNQMYWIDRYSYEFVSFDLVNHSFKTLWKADSTAFHVSPEFQWIEGGMLTEIVYGSVLDDKKAVVLEKIDFQNGTTTDLFRIEQSFSDPTMDGFLSLQLTQNAKGDTLAVFVHSEFYTSVGYRNSIISINMKRKEVEQALTIPGRFNFEGGALILKGSQAWVSAGLNYESSSIINFNLENGIKNWEITTTDLSGIQLADDKIIAFNDFGNYAFQAATGDKIWQNSVSLYNPVIAKNTWFELDGRLFMVRKYNLVQLDLETGCILKSQAIEFASDGNWPDAMCKDPVLNVIYFGLRSQMLALQL